MEKTFSSSEMIWLTAISKQNENLVWDFTYNTHFGGGGVCGFFSPFSEPNENEIFKIREQ